MAGPTHTAAVALGAAVTFAAVGCGGGAADPPPPPQKPPPTVTLKRTYDFQGRKRSVVTAMAVSPTTARSGDPLLSVPRGRRAVSVKLRIEDRGRDPFPLGWARFTLVSRTGARSAGYTRSPVRRLQPNRRRSPREAVLTYFVPKDFVAAQVRLSSIVTVWPFRARWALE